MFVSFQDFVGKQGTFLQELWPDSAEKRDILWHRRFGHGVELDIGILFIDELLVISDSRKLDFRTVTCSWMGGIGRIGKLKINGIVSQSVIYVSGSAQGGEF